MVAGLKPRLNTSNHHGINLPLSALRSHQSEGIGDFYDLIPLLHWCKKIGFNTLQLLPLNDSGQDPSPYNALSAYALHPIYLRLTELPHFDSHADLLSQVKQLQTLTMSDYTPYHAVLNLKTDILNAYIQRERLSLKKEFIAFATQFPWIKIYALFKTLKEVHEQKHWQDWPEQHKQGYTKELEKEFLEGIERHSLIQLLCFKQWAAIKKEAELLHLELMGDLPILISADSADVWHHRSYFDLSLQAGAPPDLYNPKGQNWGSPLYHWHILEKEDFQWWKERLKVCEILYDIYRIDHVVGFFRIWGIKAGESAQQGHFVPQDPQLWHPQGEKIIQMLLDSCKALPVGEDLGTVPPSVKLFLHSKGICGTRVMRWERNWEGDQAWIPVEKYDHLSLTTVSTHDSETLGQWWSLQKEEARLYAISEGWPYTEKLEKKTREAILLKSHQSGSLFHINLLQEYLCLFPTLSWEDQNRDRINIPGIVNETNWVYRFRPYLEEFTADEELGKIIKSFSQQITPF